MSAVSRPQPFFCGLLISLLESWPLSSVCCSLSSGFPSSHTSPTSSTIHPLQMEADLSNSSGSSRSCHSFFLIGNFSLVFQWRFFSFRFGGTFVITFPWCFARKLSWILPRRTSLATTPMVRLLKTSLQKRGFQRRHLTLSPLFFFFSPSFILPASFANGWILLTHSLCALCLCEIMALLDLELGAILGLRETTSPRSSLASISGSARSPPTSISPSSASSFSRWGL